MSDMKTLRVCLSKDLPVLSERDPTFIYFLYDKLMVFAGQSIYSDPFAIVEDVPENPIHNMLYFTLNDGKVKVYVNYSVREIAAIEDEEQLNILKQSGTTYFVNSERRYLDLNRRIVTLPFQNGTYELTVSLANELMIDEDTVIGFNPETNMFEIIGHKQDFDMVFTKGYRGKNTDSVKMQVSDNRVSGELKLSAAYDNMLKIVSDGVYANAGDRVTIKQFESWVKSFTEYKTNMEFYLRDLIEKYDASQDIVSPQSISQRILSALEEVYPEIDEALAKYNAIASQFEGIEKRTKDYADTQYALAYADLYNAIIEASANPWEYFGDIPEPPQSDPDENGVVDPDDPIDPDDGDGNKKDPENSDDPKDPEGDDKDPDDRKNNEGGDPEEPKGNNGENEGTDNKENPEDPKENGESGEGEDPKDPSTTEPEEGGNGEGQDPEEPKNDEGDDKEKEPSNEDESTGSGENPNEAENGSENENPGDESEPKKEESEDAEPENPNTEPELENSETL